MCQSRAVQVAIADQMEVSSVYFVYILTYFNLLRQVLNVTAKKSDTMHGCFQSNSEIYCDNKVELNLNSYVTRHRKF